MTGRRRFREPSPDSSVSSASNIRPSKLPRRSDHKEVLATIENLMTKLTDPSSQTVQSRVEHLSYYVTDSLHIYKKDILHILIACILRHPMQSSVYATFVGLVNSRDYEFGAACMTFVMDQLLSSLHEAEWMKARGMLLMLGDLVNTNVITVGSMLQLLNTLVAVCDQEDSPQARRDFYVHLVLSTLAALGRELYEKKEKGLNALIQRIQVYMKKQRNAANSLKLLRVWTNTEMPQHEYLELLWQQILHLMRNNWIEQQLPRPYLAFDEALSSSMQHNLPALHIPKYEADANIVYPHPWIVVHLFEANDCPPNVNLPEELTIERHIIESHILDMLQLKHLECKACVDLLLSYCGANPNLAVPYCIVEVILGQMLQLPHSPYLTINYGAIIIELCKQKPHIFSRVIGQAVDMIFTQIESMCVSSFDRFVNWFSHHLSNFRYQWNWADWESCLNMHELHPSLMFVRELLKKCMRFSYYQFIVQMVPRSFAPVVPLSPDPQFKYINELLPGAMFAKHLLGAIRSKCAPEVIGGVMEATTDLTEELKINVLTQTLLHLGCKSFTHAFCIFNRFQAVLRMLVTNEATQRAMLGAVFELWAKNEHTKFVISEKLMRMQLVSAKTLISWIFSAAMERDLAKLYIWELLSSTVRFAKHLAVNESSEVRINCLLLDIVEHCCKAVAKHRVKQMEDIDYWTDWVLGRLQALLFNYPRNVQTIGHKLRKIATDFDESKRLILMIEGFLAMLVK